MPDPTPTAERIAEIRRALAASTFSLQPIPGWVKDMLRDLLAALDAATARADAAERERDEAKELYAILLDASARTEIQRNDALRLAEERLETNVAATRQRDKAQAEVDRLAGLLAAAQEQGGRLREALEEAMRWCPGCGGVRLGWCVSYDWEARWVDCSECRSARAALAGEGKAGDE